ncbi:MAG: hypothetical protein H6Q15_893 [Bacteroidetes bacterium]|nr:hypothetical protein [Bacteroidota bacterium]
MKFLFDINLLNPYFVVGNPCFEVFLFDSILARVATLGVLW